MSNPKGIMRLELLHSGKANDVYTTSDPRYLEIEASDRVSAGNGEKKSTIAGKGLANSRISSDIFKYLESYGIPTHYAGNGSTPSSMLVKKADMIELEVICRNKALGSFTKRYPCATNYVLSQPLVEYTYKNDNKDFPQYSDPPIDRKTIVALGIASELEVQFMDFITTRVNELMTDYYATRLQVQLVDFKIEFGRIPSSHGNIVICDEVSPDTCRLIDFSTGESFDKDRFRNSMDDPSMGYRTLLKRLTGEVI